ncbi:alpha/beta fold hydrolase [Streptomyces sp. NPDC101149]|uniref:alpha/beta fold hydrolase n=1 Tax=Streptomyces sp. NPDC101149 TaxID=3366113 RepID=UPI003803D52E
MPSFSAHDGTELACHVFGDDPRLARLPGGTVQDSAYLAGLGGLSAHRRSIMPDPGGTGRSAAPEDIASYRCDRAVDGMDALRERLDLLAYFARTNLALPYTERHPAHVGGLAPITPRVAAVGVTTTGDVRRETARLRRGEAWFPVAYAALESMVSGRATTDSRQEIAPFRYGRWDEAAQTRHAAGSAQRNGEAAAVFGAEGVFAPDATRTAPAVFGQPVLLLTGKIDPTSPPPAAAEAARSFPRAEPVVQPAPVTFRGSTTPTVSRPPLRPSRGERARPWRPSAPGRGCPPGPSAPGGCTHEASAGAFTGRSDRRARYCRGVGRRPLPPPHTIGRTSTRELRQG